MRGHSSDTYPESTLSCELGVLERVLLTESQEISRRVLVHTPEIAINRMRKTIVARLVAEVYRERLDGEEHVFTERAVYETWRDQYLATLDRDGFWFRFLSRFWGHDVRMKQTTHIVKVDDWAVLPEGPARYPAEMGPVVFQRIVTTSSEPA